MEYGETLEFTICHECSVVFANGDDTSPDVDLNAIGNFCAVYGMIAYVGEVETDGYGECECCHQLFIDNAHKFETV